MEQYGVDPDESVTSRDEDYQVHIDPPTFALQKSKGCNYQIPFKSRNNYLNSVKVMILFLFSEEETEEWKPTKYPVDLSFHICLGF